MSLAVLGAWSDQDPVNHLEANTFSYFICVFLYSFYKALFVE